VRNILSVGDSGDGGCWIERDLGASLLLAEEVEAKNTGDGGVGRPRSVMYMGVGFQVWAAHLEGAQIYRKCKEPRRPCPDALRTAQAANPTDLATRTLDPVATARIEPPPRLQDRSPVVTARRGGEPGPATTGSGRRACGSGCRETSLVAGERPRAWRSPSAPGVARGRRESVRAHGASRRLGVWWGYLR